MVETRRSPGSSNSTPHQPSNVSHNSYKNMYPELKKENMSHVTSNASSRNTTLNHSIDSSDSTESPPSDGSEDEKIVPPIDQSFQRHLHSRPRETLDKTWVIAIGAIVVILAILYLAISKSDSDRPTATQKTQNYEKFIASARSLIKSSYSDFSEDNKAILRLMGKHVYMNDDKSPLVVVISGPRAEKFAQTLGSIFQNDKSEVIRIASDTDRAILHENLKNALGERIVDKNTPRTAVVTNIDLLQWDAVLVVHAFGDHLKYPVPNTILLLTTSENLKVESGDSDCDETTTSFLRNQWIENGGSTDNIPPIISRLGHFMCI